MCVWAKGRRKLVTKGLRNIEIGQNVVSVYGVRMELKSAYAIREGTQLQTGKTRPRDEPSRKHCPTEGGLLLRAYEKRRRVHAVIVAVTQTDGRRVA